MAGGFVQPGSHPVAGQFGPNLKPVVPTASVDPEPAYTVGHEVNMTNHTEDTSDVVAKQNIALDGGGHTAAGAPMTGRTGKHLAKW